MFYNVKLKKFNNKKTNRSTLFYISFNTQKNINIGNIYYDKK